MKGKRSSILLYFDNFHRVADLPDEQLGILFRALMECGEREAAGEDGITGFEQRYPNMGEKTQMAFSFMADTIRRDAASYAEKCANYRAAAQHRWDLQRESQAIPDSPPADELERLVRQQREKTGRPDWAAL